MNAHPFNRIEGSGDRGIVATGFVYRKLLDVLGDEPREGVRVLKLGVLYPLPRDLVVRWLAACREVLVLEENEPFLEMQIKAVAHESSSHAHLRKTNQAHSTRR